MFCHHYRSGYQSSGRLNDLPKSANLLTKLPGSENNSIARSFARLHYGITLGLTLFSINSHMLHSKMFFTINNEEISPAHSNDSLFSLSQYINSLLLNFNEMMIQLRLVKVSLKEKPKNKCSPVI